MHAGFVIGPGATYMRNVQLNCQSFLVGLRCQAGRGMCCGRRWPKTKGCRFGWHFGTECRLDTTAGRAPRHDVVVELPRGGSSVRSVPGSAASLPLQEAAPAAAASLPPLPAEPLGAPPVVYAAHLAACKVRASAYPSGPGVSRAWSAQRASLQFTLFLAGFPPSRMFPHPTQFVTWAQGPRCPSRRCWRVRRKLRGRSRLLQRPPRRCSRRPRSAGSRPCRPWGSCCSRWPGACWGCACCASGTSPTRRAGSKRSWPTGTLTLVRCLACWQADSVLPAAYLALWRCVVLHVAVWILPV